MERDEIIKRINIIIRGLSQPNNEIDESSEINSVRKEVEEEDKPKLACSIRRSNCIAEGRPGEQSQNKGNMEQTNGWLWAYQAYVRSVGISETVFSR